MPAKGEHLSVYLINVFLVVVGSGSCCVGVGFVKFCVMGAEGLCICVRVFYLSCVLSCIFVFFCKWLGFYSRHAASNPDNIGA